MATDVVNEDLQRGFAEHRDQTETQVGQLKEVFEIIDERPEERQSLVFDALVEERNKFFDRVSGNEDMCDLYDLGAGVKTEHLEPVQRADIRGIGVDFVKDDQNRFWAVDINLATGYRDIGLESALCISINASLRDHCSAK